MRNQPFETVITFQYPCDGGADAFRSRLGLAVADVSVAQRHARILVTKQAGDHWQGDTLQHGVAGVRMPNIM